jgi:DNA-binding NtrC family response regulator
VIAATNRPETLRPEFHARFGLRVEVPALDSRPEDVPLIARWLANRQARREAARWKPFLSSQDDAEVQFSPDFVRTLVGRPYAGNVRELEALIWASLRDSVGPRLETPVAHQHAQGVAPPATESVAAPDPRSLDPARIQDCLDANRGSIETTWRALNLTSRHVLVRLIKKHGLRTR